MNDSNASLKRHCDCHFVFGDSVHRGRNKWYSESDVTSKLRGKIDVAEGEMNVTRHHDDVVVSVGDASGILDKHLSSIEPAFVKANNEREVHRHLVKRGTRNVCLPFRTRIQGLLVDVGQLESFAAIFSGIGVAVHLASNTFLNYQDTLKQEVDDSKQMFLGIVVFRCR